jgi:hypothetical protein
MARTNPTQISPKTPAATAAVEPVPGSLHVEWVRCGKPGCRCARGQRHGPYVRRHWREGGRKRSTYIRLGDVGRTRVAVATWRAQHRSVRSLLREFCARDRAVWRLLDLLGTQGGHDGT